MQATSPPWSAKPFFLHADTRRVHAVHVFTEIRHRPRRPARRPAHPPRLGLGAHRQGCGAQGGSGRHQPYLRHVYGDDHQTRRSATCPLHEHEEKEVPRFGKAAHPLSRTGDIRNTAYLTWSYRDINKDDDMWVYMPAESLVRCISVVAKRAPSCAATTPMRTFHGGKSTRTPIPCCPTRPSPAWTATYWRRKRSSLKRRTIPNGLSGSGKISGCPRKSTSTIRAGTGARNWFSAATRRYRASGPPPRQRMRTVGSDSETIMEIREVTYNTPIAEDIFLPQDLKR